MKCAWQRFTDASEVDEQAFATAQVLVEPGQAVADLTARLERDQHPVIGLKEQYLPFWRTIIASPALRSRARELVDDITDHIAALIAASESSTDTLPPRLQAAFAVAVIREAFTAAAARMLDGEAVATVNADYGKALTSGFAHLQRLVPHDTD